MRLQTLVAREVSSNDQAVLTVGRLQAGTKHNIIPDTAELDIDIRSFSDETRNHLRVAVERVVRAEAQASAAPRDPVFDWNFSVPVLISDPDATDVTVSAFHCHFGVDRMLELPTRACLQQTAGHHHADTPGAAGYEGGFAGQVEKLRVRGGLAVRHWVTFRRRFEVQLRSSSPRDLLPSLAGLRPIPMGMLAGVFWGLRFGRDDDPGRNVSIGCMNRL